MSFINGSCTEKDRHSVPGSLARSLTETLNLSHSSVLRSRGRIITLMVNIRSDLWGWRCTSDHFVNSNNCVFHHSPPNSIPSWLLNPSSWSLSLRETMHRSINSFSPIILFYVVLLNSVVPVTFPTSLFFRCSLLESHKKCRTSSYLRLLLLPRCRIFFMHWNFLLCSDFLLTS